MSELKKYDFASLEAMRNPFPTWQQMLDDGPIVRSRFLLVNQVWLATSWEAVNELLRNQNAFGRDPQRVGKNVQAGFKWWMPRRFMRLANNMMAVDGQDHRRLRSLVDHAFHRSQMESMREHIASVCERLLDELMGTESGQNPSSAHEIVEGFCRRLPLIVICEILGLPDEDRPKFKKWFRAFSEIKNSWGFVKLLPSASKLLRYLDEQYELLKAEPREGLLSALVQAKVEGESLTKDELVASIFLLLLAGHETTVHLLSTSIYTLLTHLEAAEQLRSDYEMMPTAVEELLRYNTPVQLTKPRYVIEDCDFFGQRMKRGELLMGCLGSANADPAKFNDPTQLDLKREPNPHLAFGTGVHVCLGMKLAKVEAEVALKVLLTRYPKLKLAEGEAAVRWRPRVGLRTIRELHVATS